MKNLLLGIGAVLIVSGVAAYAVMQNTNPSPPEEVVGATAEVPEGAIVITLTEDGYVPSEITISKGTTIAFVTENGKIFWPASNLHPSHSLYPEFDPKMPIQPDEAWSFTFTNVGEWRFHDHLAPYYTGTITVTE